MIPIRSAIVSAVLLSKMDGEIKLLLMKRVKGDFWCHIAGKLEANETATQAVIREIYEETRVGLQALYNADYIEQFYEPSLNVIEMIPAFVGICADHQSIQLNHEHTAFRWCSLEEALHLAEFTNQKSLYQHIWQSFVHAQPSALLHIKDFELI